MSKLNRCASSLQLWCSMGENLQPLGNCAAVTVSSPIRATSRLGWKFFKESDNWNFEHESGQDQEETQLRSKSQEGPTRKGKLDTQEATENSHWLGKMEERLRLPMKRLKRELGEVEGHSLSDSDYHLEIPKRSSWSLLGPHNVFKCDLRVEGTLKNLEVKIVLSFNVVVYRQPLVKSVNSVICNATPNRNSTGWLWELKWSKDKTLFWQWVHNKYKWYNFLMYLLFAPFVKVDLQEIDDDQSVSSNQQSIRHETR